MRYYSNTIEYRASLDLPHEGARLHPQDQGLVGALPT